MEFSLACFTVLDNLCKVFERSLTNNFISTIIWVFRCFWLIGNYFWLFYWLCAFVSYKWLTVFFSITRISFFFLVCFKATKISLFFLKTTFQWIITSFFNKSNSFIIVFHDKALSSLTDIFFIALAVFRIYIINKREKMAL